MNHDLPYPICNNGEREFLVNQIKTPFLLNAIEECTSLGFYYPFNFMENNNIIHRHEHDFEQVIYELYRRPESFKLIDSDLEWYSKQEIKYINNLQKFLLAVGRSDTDKITEELTNNQLVNDFKKYFYCSYSKDVCEKIISDGEYIDAISLNFKMDLGTCETRVLIDDDFHFYGLVQILPIKIENNNDKWILTNKIILLSKYEGDSNV